MRFNTLKVAVVYTVSCLVWFAITTEIIIWFESCFSGFSVRLIHILLPLLFVVMNTIVVYKLVKLNNKTIRQKEDDFLNLYLGNPNPLWIYDLHTLKFVSVNEAAITTYGYSREEFLGMTINDIRKLEERGKLTDSVTEFVNQPYAAGSWRISGTWQHQKKDGFLIYANITSHKIIFEGTECAMVLASDTTEQVKYEQQLEQMNQVLQQEKQKQKETEKLAKVSGWEYFVEDGKLVWSDELYEIFDIDREPEKVNYSSILKSVHKEDLLNYNQAIENLLKRGVDLNVNYRFVTKTGLVKYAKVLGKMYYRDNKMYKVQGTMQDVTELTLAQLEKHKYQQSLKNTLNNINDGYFLINRNWVITAVNANSEKMLNRPQEKIVNHHYFELFPGAQNTNFYLNYKKVLEKGIPVNFEDYSPYARKWLCVNAYPTEEGAAVYFTDITENKEKDLQLKEALERYELVAKATHDVIYDFDAANNQVKYSGSIEDLLGFATESITDSNEWWKNKIHPDDLDRVLRKHKQAIRNKEENCGLEYRLKTNNNQYKYVYDQGYLQYDGQQKFVRMIGAIKDIDQLKRFDDENKRLADIITKVNNMIVIMDADSKIIWVNKAFENYTGYTLCAITGKMPVFLYGPESDPKAPIIIDEAKKAFRDFSIDVINYKANGEKYWVNIEFTPLFNSDGKFEGYISIQNNITARKEKEEKIRHQNEILKNIAWMGSHELRKPVASILGLIELITETDDSAEKEESICLMQQCTLQLDQIIRTINQKIEEEISEE